MSELTREQVEMELMQLLNGVGVGGNILGHDAALRARVAELERELDASQTLLRKSCEDLRKQIDTVTAERDSWHADASSHLMALCEKQAEVNALKLTWTTARPTVAGNYYFRDIRNHPSSDRIIEYSQSDLDDPYRDQDKWYRWAGPIMGPEEGTP